MLQLLVLPPRPGNRVTTPKNSSKQWFPHVPVNIQMEHVSGGFSSFLRWILFLTIDYDFIWCDTSFGLEPPLSTAFTKAAEMRFQPSWGGPQKNWAPSTRGFWIWLGYISARSDRMGDLRWWLQTRVVPFPGHRGYFYTPEPAGTGGAVFSYNWKLVLLCASVWAWGCIYELF